MISLAKVLLITSLAPFTASVCLILLGIFDGDGKSLAIGILTLCLSFLMFFAGFCGVTLDEKETRS